MLREYTRPKSRKFGVRISICLAFLTDWRLFTWPICVRFSALRCKSLTNLQYLMNVVPFRFWWGWILENYFNSWSLLIDCGRNFFLWVTLKILGLLEQPLGKSWGIFPIIKFFSFWLSRCKWPKWYMKLPDFWLWFLA